MNVELLCPYSSTLFGVEGSMVYTGGTLGRREEEEEGEGERDLEAAAASGSLAATLQPFVHQVGGHTRMLLLDSSTICKPLILRELNFYRNIPQDIKCFTPNFKGVMQVSMERGRDFVTLRNVSPSSGVARSNMGMVESSESKKGNKCLSVKVISEESPRLNRLLDKSSENQKETHFLMLENVASKFYRPCVLDLKMGTRQHGDDAPEEKRHRHMAKCAASTSASLGVRVCGMQVYQADLGMYLCKDKYFGRRLDEEGFKHTLHEFFHNGFTMRTRVVRQVVEKLRRLRRVVEKQNSYRFYSSSLLVIYEGCVEEESGHCGDDSEMELSCSWDSDRHGTTSPREDSVALGLEEKSSAAAAEDGDSADEMFHEEGVCVRRDASVDVRMIDFAHATYEGYVGDSMIHRGPDNGYMLGLDNLCRVLVDILAETENEKE